MKPDWNLMRQIALAVDDTPIGTVQRQPSVECYSADEVGYHVHLLLEAGLARGNDVRNMGHTHPHALISGLTLAGHEFAELARDETRWVGAMAEARSTGPITLNTLKRLLSTPQPRQSLPKQSDRDVDTFTDSIRSAAAAKASDSHDRGFWLTAQVFPSALTYVPEKLGWAVERIVDEHEDKVRKAVIEALNGLRSSGDAQTASVSIFEAVVEMGSELFNEALDRYGWMDDNNPPDVYDGTADELYEDAINFVKWKYKSLASEVPGLSPACEPSRLDALRTDWLQIREEAKQEVHEWSRKIRESQAEADRLRAGSTASPGSDEAPAKERGGKPSGGPEPAGAPSSNRPNLKEAPPGSMDRVSMTDPIWDFSGTQNGPISIKRLSGEVDTIDPSIEDEPDDADLKPEEELRISEATISGRSELRSEIETAFSGPDWPPPHAIVQAFRRHAVKVFDANAAAYNRAISEQKRDAKETLTAMSRNLLVGLFGREWENSPGERVVRIRWEDGADGWKGQEIAVIAGNDPDPTCLYHQLVGDAIKHRYRFHAPLPPHVPGEPPGLGVSNLEWWQYIGLKERHNLAMVIKPYLEDRMAHWQFAYAASVPTDTGCGVEAGPAQRGSARASEAAGDRGGLKRTCLLDFPNRAAWLRERLAERAWNRNDPLKHRGPDPKTIDKILRGETVREDVLEKLATSLSQKGKAVDLLNIPRN